ncbi:MAG TPA: Cof-type HAD-IIB family hydrolase [Anaerovoracaceae bacterium]|nr:Cof-type HAD-IIB family hydrolase [Anaerovoracaceae bacterium]
MSIKLIGLDLDGTTLNSQERITDKTRSILEKTIKSGVNVVFATGRSFDSLPKDVYNLEGVEYMITSNGAQVTRMIDKKVIYKNCIKNNDIKKVIDIVTRHKVHVEAFIDGIAYIDKTEYNDIKANGSTYRSAGYVIRTRKPVDDIIKHMYSNQDSIENINLLFEDSEKRRFIRKLLENLEGITLTTSFANNLEIGGATTSKADALNYLLRINDLTENELMAFGDNPNDIAMIEFAKIGVAMGNADILVKQASDYITDDNNNHGVANAIEKIILHKNA